MSVRFGNILYMLAYACRFPVGTLVKRFKVEKFKHVDELYATIISGFMEGKLKAGLGRGYVECEENMSRPVGSIDISGSMRLAARQSRMLACRHDEYDTDTLFNQLLKATMAYLARKDPEGTPVVSAGRHAMLRKQLRALSGVSCKPLEYFSRSQSMPPNPSKIDRILHSTCFLVRDSLLPDLTSDDPRGSPFISVEFRKTELDHLYESFVREYYKYHFRGLDVSASHVRWNMYKGDDSSLDSFRARYLGYSSDLLPSMKTDITLFDPHTGKKLIIDTKSYNKALASIYGKERLISSHLYQVFSYVVNSDSSFTGRIGGMLLYARTDEADMLDENFLLAPGGIYIGARTLDLAGDFSSISSQLDRIAMEYFGAERSR